MRQILKKMDKKMVKSFPRIGVFLSTIRAIPFCHDMITIQTGFILSYRAFMRHEIFVLADVKLGKKIHLYL